MATRRDITKKYARAYQHADKIEKTRLLDGLVETTGWTRDHARRAIRQALAADILCFNVESAAELERIERLAAAHGRPAPVSFRVNPDVDPKTHPYISTGLKNNKFGVSLAEAERLYLEAARLPGITIAGIASHIGSPNAVVNSSVT